MKISHTPQQLSFLEQGKLTQNEIEMRCFKTVFEVSITIFYTLHKVKWQ